MKAPRRTNKYGAVPTVIDGIRFASKAEARRYVELRRMAAVGLIHNLTLQPRFPCRVEGVDVCVYIADFAYFRDNARVIEDVKSKVTRTPVYRVKKKLVEALYRVAITEVGR